MSEPATAAAGGALLHKLAWGLLGLATFLGAPLLAFFLGLKVIPLNPKDREGDVIRRLIGCAVSSLILGLPALLWLVSSQPWMFEASRGLMVMLHWWPEIGPLLVLYAVLLLSALPGWWFVGSLVRKAARQDYDALLDRLNKSEVHP